MKERLEIADGKYTLINDNGEITALRYGEPWNHDFTGDKLIYCMMQELLEALAARAASPQEAPTARAVALDPPSTMPSALHSPAELCHVIRAQGSKP